MVRISAIFISTCMVLIAGSIGFVVYLRFGFTGAESALVASEPLETWKDWLAYHLIEAYAPALPKAIADERFAFFGKAMTGATESRAWSNASIGEEPLPRSLTIDSPSMRLPLGLRMV